MKREKAQKTANAQSFWSLEVAVKKADKDTAHAIAK